MPDPDVQSVDGANGDRIEEYRTQGQVELPAREEGEPHPVCLAVHPSHHHIEGEGNNGGTCQHDKSEDNILGVVAGGVSD